VIEADAHQLLGRRREGLKGVPALHALFGTGAKADIAFAPAVVELTRVTQGDFLAASGRSVGGLGPETPAAGQAALGAYSYSSLAAVSGAGSLVHLRFRGLASGSTALDLSDALLASVDGADVSSQGVGASLMP
jgi:hypothetical protein